MKKIVYVYPTTLAIFNPKDYITIEKDNQYISDKYIDLVGNKFNEYKDSGALKKGDVVIRELYYILFLNADIFVRFNKFKYYDRHSNTSRIKQGIRTKNSTFDFDYIKGKIVEIFSRDVKIEIK